MKKNLLTPFSARQYMLSPNFELYYYNDTALTHVASHIHNFYEFCFFLEGNVTMQIDDPDSSGTSPSLDHPQLRSSLPPLRFLD